MNLTEELLIFYKKNKTKIKQRLQEFALVPKEDYFYELCYCLLTPQSKAENAEIVIKLLKERDFLHKNFIPNDIISNPKHYIRFHNNKAKHLIYAKEIFPKILEILDAKTSQYNKRDFLTKTVLGFGMKESSHFLRNIGFSNLAILDRHILKNLLLCNVIEKVPKSLTKSLYLAIEQKYLLFADQINISLDELDLLFWSYQTGKILK